MIREQLLLNQEHGPVWIPLLQLIQRRRSGNATTIDNVIPVACLFASFIGAKVQTLYLAHMSTPEIIPKG